MTDTPDIVEWLIKEGEEWQPDDPTLESPTGNRLKEAADYIDKLEADKVFLLEQGLGARNDALEQAAKVGQKSADSPTMRQYTGREIRALKEPTA